MTSRLPRRRNALALMVGLGLGPSAPRPVGATDADADADAPRERRLALDDTAIELQFEPLLGAALDAPLAEAVRRAAAAVRGYFGRFPLAALEVQFQAGKDSASLDGTTFADPAPWIRVRVGRRVDAAQLAGDWVLVHEMVHLALPRVPRSQRWLHEGVATYVEALARAQAGWITAPSVWQAWMRNMPQGLPLPGDQGLDHTPTWARTYWGGALFCLLADVALLCATEGRAGLRQGLRALLVSGADHRQVSDAAHILAAIDRALGTTALARLYAEHAEHAVATDLSALWRDLGVSADGFDDAAPLAAVRRAILA